MKNMLYTTIVVDDSNSNIVNMCMICVNDYVIHYDPSLPVRGWLLHSRPASLNGVWLPNGWQSSALHYNFYTEIQRSCALSATSLLVHFAVPEAWRSPSLQQGNSCWLEPFDAQDRRTYYPLIPLLHLSNSSLILSIRANDWLSCAGWNRSSRPDRQIHR